MTGRLRVTLGKNVWLYMEYRDGVGDQLVTMKKVVMQSVRLCTERKSNLPFSEYKVVASLAWKTGKLPGRDGWEASRNL